MPIGLTSSLSDLIQKAIQIETNLIQQKIDDKLRAAQKEEHSNKQQSSIINNLFNVRDSNLSHLPSTNTQHSYDKSSDNYNNNKNQNSFGNKYSRTFTNSTTSSFGLPDAQHKPYNRSNVNRNIKGKFKNNNRWCSFCSSTSHSWRYCYSNPNGLNYQPSNSQHVQQQQPSNYKSNLPSYNSTYPHSRQPQHYQQLEPNEPVHQQQSQQLYSSPVSSSHCEYQRSSIQGNVQGSRY
jgi:hypothetical protein